MKDRLLRRIPPWLAAPLLLAILAGTLWPARGSSSAAGDPPPLTPEPRRTLRAETPSNRPEKTEKTPTPSAPDTARGTAISVMPPSAAVGNGAYRTPIHVVIEDGAESETTAPNAEDAPPEALPQAPGARAVRFQALELAAREADRHTRWGFELAGRGAWCSARAEFVAALRLVAQALDTDRQTAQRSAALASAMTALREAEGFLAGGSRLEADLDLAAIIAAHRTPILKRVECSRLTPQVALQSYFTFAQEQLAAGAGEEFAGSMALHGLGKLHAALAGQQAQTVRAAQPKAMAFYQAALLTCPRNFLASNDLGVLLARAGRHEDARTALEHSVSIQPQSVGWHNLSVVYRQLGRPDLAQQAYRHWTAAVQAETARRGRPAPAAQMVRWVDPAAFAPSPSERPPAPQGVRNPRATGWFVSPDREKILLCQALGPAAPCPVCAVDCSKCNRCWRDGWEGARASFWQAYAQGEYVGHARAAHVPEYRLRVDDQLDMVYRVTREETAQPYKLNVGDEIRVESFTDQALSRELIIQPDGTITLRLLGQVRATGRTVSQLRDELERLYLKYYKVPAMTVTPLKVNTKLEDLRATVDRRQGVGGQSQLVKVTPEGTISLPAIGPAQAQGLTLSELQKELNERYREEVEGIEVIPVLVQRAPRYVYVLGEVRNPGRFELTGPTTVIQALSMAGSWNVGANLRQVVVFRRGDDWRLMATMLNLHRALYAKQPCPPGEIWLSDSDVVLVPKQPILVADELIDLVFTRGIYGVFPLSASLNFSKLSSL